MLGERYFHSRDRLLACCRRIEALAEASGLPPKTPGGDVGEEIIRARRIVALGEVNAGKSSLLNALAGVEICPVDAVPTTKATTLYVYSKSERETVTDYGWKIEGKPVDFLSRFELIDTPGTNGKQKDDVFSELGLLESADLVLVVFPAENTWTAATWELISKLSDEALERTLLVVQQADRKQAEDLPVIANHMCELSVKKVGHKLPIRAVSAKLALEAKLSNTAKPVSHFIDFEDYITAQLCGPDRHELLEKAADEAASRLREIEEDFDRQKRGMSDDGWFLASLEREANQLRDAMLEHSPATVAGARGRYENEVGRLARSIKRMQGVFPTLWALMFGDHTAAKAEARLAEGLSDAIRDFAEADARRLLVECHEHWIKVRPRIEERMGMDPGDSGLFVDQREKVATDFVDTVSRSVTSVLSQLRVRASLDSPLRARCRQLKLLLVVALVLLIGAGVCGSLKISDWAFYLGISSSIWMGVFVLASWLSAQKISQKTRRRLRDAVGQFESALRSEYMEAVRNLFVEYANGFITVRRQLADREASLKPRTEQWDKLHLQLSAIQQELRE